jgi:hypothetical protein
LALLPKGARTLQAGPEAVNQGQSGQCLGFKKLQNRAYMVALYALWYNFVRIHKTLRVHTMAPGIADRLWSMEDVVALIDGHAERRAPKLADRLAG